MVTVVKTSGEDQAIGEGATLVCSKSFGIEVVMGYGLAPGAGQV